MEPIFPGTIWTKRIENETTKKRKERKTRRKRKNGRRENKNMGNLVASFAHSGGVVSPLFETDPSTKFIEAWSPWIDEDEDKKKTNAREKEK